VNIYTGYIWIYFTVERIHIHIYGIYIYILIYFTAVTADSGEVQVKNLDLAPGANLETC